MTRAELEDALIAWAAGQLYPDGGRAILADQNGPRPALPFATVKITATPTFSDPNVSPPDDYGDAIITFDHTAMVSVQVYGGDAAGLAERLFRSLGRETVREALRAAGLAFADWLTPVNDTTQVVATENEPRFGFDARFVYSAEITDQVGVIEHVEATATLDGVDHAVQIGA